jgi:hypothetical protein
MSVKIEAEAALSRIKVAVKLLEAALVSSDATASALVEEVREELAFAARLLGSAVADKSWK